MRNALYPRPAVVVLWGLVLGMSTGPLRAGDPAKARALLNRAIKATGGEAKLDQLKAATWKARGTAYDMGLAVPFTGEWATQAPDQKRSTIEGEANGQKFKFISVVNGDMGWLQLNGNTDDMTREELAEAREEMYADNLGRLVPLKDRAFQLKLLPESKVGDRPAVGLEVSRKKHRDLRLYFDKESGLLVKSETTIKDKSGKDMVQETLYAEPREVQGVQVPTKIVIKRDGKPFVEGEAFDYKLEEKLDDSLFDRP